MLYIYIYFFCLEAAFHNGWKLRSDVEWQRPKEPCFCRPPFRGTKDHWWWWWCLQHVPYLLKQFVGIRLLGHIICIKEFVLMLAPKEHGLATCIEQMWLCGNVSIKMLDCHILVARDGCKPLRDRSSYQAFLKELTERFIRSPDVCCRKMCYCINSCCWSKGRTHTQIGWLFSI